MASYLRTEPCFPSSPFDLRETEESGSLRLSIIGELDLASAPALEERLGRLASRTRLVRLDLSALEFIDSTGVRVLIEAARRARRDEWLLEVVGNASPQVRRVLELVGAESYVLGDGRTESHPS